MTLVERNEKCGGSRGPVLSVPCIFAWFVVLVLMLCYMTAKDYMVLRRSLAKHDEVSLGIGNDLRCRKKNAYDMQTAATNRRPRNANEHLSTNADNRRKPFFVIHAGPHKTATTTLQTALLQWDEVLKKDNYVYLGKHLPNLYNTQSAIYKALFSDTITVAAQKYYQDID